MCRMAAAGRPALGGHDLTKVQALFSSVLLWCSEQGAEEMM